MGNGLLIAQQCLFQSQGLDIVEIITFSPEFWVRDFNDLVDQVTWSAFESLISHVLIFNQEVVWSSSSHIESKGLKSLSNLLPSAKVTFSTNNLTFSFTSGAGIGEQIVKAVS